MLRREGLAEKIASRVVEAQAAWQAAALRNGESFDMYMSTAVSHAARFTVALPDFALCDLRDCHSFGVPLTPKPEPASAFVITSTKRSTQHIVSLSEIHRIRFRTVTPLGPFAFHFTTTLLELRLRMYNVSRL